MPSSVWLIKFVGGELEDYITRLGWKYDSSAGVVEVPPNPDNQIASTVVQEDIKLQRMFRLVSAIVLLTAAYRTNKNHLTCHSSSVSIPTQKLLVYIICLVVDIDEIKCRITV
jgi:hypothetical protein